MNHVLVLPDLAKYVKISSDLVTADHESEVLPIPKCYFARFEGGESSNDMIIMENLEKKDFMFNTNVEDETINKAHVEIVIREIAKLHAISYCAKVSFMFFCLLASFNKLESS